MDVAEYFKCLENHDWYYSYSDDHGVWTKGQEESSRINSIAHDNPTLVRMLKDYSDWFHMGVESRREMHKPELKDYLN